MASDPASSPTVEETLRSAAARFALLADVLELQALGIERADQPVGPEGSRALAETCRQAVGDLQRTPERSPSGSAQLVRRGQAAGGPTPMSLMRTYRRALGLSQSAFAAQLNVPPTAHGTQAAAATPHQSQDPGGLSGRDGASAVAGPGFDDRRACSHAARSRAFRPTSADFTCT